MVRKVSLHVILFSLVALGPKIMIWYFRPARDLTRQICKFLLVEEIFIRNFAPVVRKVSLRVFLSFLVALRPKITIRCFRPACVQMVLLTSMQPEIMFGTFDCGATKNGFKKVQLMVG